jgi:hypothetical protein
MTTDATGVDATPDPDHGTHRPNYSSGFYRWPGQNRNRDYHSGAHRGSSDPQMRAQRTAAPAAAPPLAAPRQSVFRWVLRHSFFSLLSLLGIAAVLAVLGIGALTHHSGTGAASQPPGAQTPQGNGGGGAAPAPGGNATTTGLPPYGDRMNQWNVTFPVGLADQDPVDFAPLPSMTDDQWRGHVNFWLGFACTHDSVAHADIAVYAVLGKADPALLVPRQGGGSPVCAVLDTPGHMTTLDENGFDRMWSGMVATTDGVRENRSVRLHFAAYPEDPSGRGHIQIDNITG